MTFLPKEIPVDPQLPSPRGVLPDYQLKPRATPGSPWDESSVPKSTPRYLRQPDHTCLPAPKRGRFGTRGTPTRRVCKTGPLGSCLIFDHFVPPLSNIYAPLVRSNLRKTKMTELASFHNLNMIRHSSLEISNEQLKYILATAHRPLLCHVGRHHFDSLR